MRMETIVWLPRKAAYAGDVEALSSIFIGHIHRAYSSGVFISAAHPELAPAAFVAPLGRQIDVVIRRVQQVDAARIGGIGVKYAAGRILIEDACSLTLGHPGI